MPEVKLGAKSEAPVARHLEINTSSGLKREVVLVAHAAMIEAKKHFGEWQKPVVLDWNADSCATKHRNDGRVSEMIEASFADDSDRWDVTFNRASHVKMRTSMAVVASLVVVHIDIRAKRRGIGTC